MLWICQSYQMFCHVKKNMNCPSAYYEGEQKGILIMDSRRLPISRWGMVEITTDVPRLKTFVSQEEMAVSEVIWHHTSVELSPLPKLCAP